MICTCKKTRKTVGQVLAILALAGLFRGGVTDRVVSAAGRKYVLGPRDVIEITVDNEPDLTGEHQVSQDGTVMVPLLGKQQAAGLTPSQLSDRIERAYEGTYVVNPQVGIRVMEQKSQEVYVVGAVKEPGVYVLSGQGTLLELMARCGGATDRAGEKIIITRLVSQKERDTERKEKTTNSPSQSGPQKDREQTQGSPQRKQIRVDRRKLLSGEAESNVTLQAGDTVLCPVAQGVLDRVYVVGDVKKGGSHPLTQELSLPNLLASAGLSPTQDKGTVTIMRKAEGDRFKEQEMMLADAFGEKGDQFTLKNRDIISVDRTQLRYYVIGEVKGPGAFHFPDDRSITVREALVVAGWITRRGDTDDIQITRKELDEWKTISAGLSEEVEPGDVIKVKERWF